MRSHLWSPGQSAVGSRQSALTTANRKPQTENHSAAPRRGFTLVELLVVIVIIIILAGLLLPVAALVIGRGKEGRILLEISGLDSAFKAYKERYGSYPPSDFTGVTAGSTTCPVALHLQKAFPRCNVATELNAINAAANNNTLSPAQAICFWLSGYSPDPEHPISGKTASNTTFLFAFNQTQFVTVASSPQVPVYVPADGLGVPYVYFAAQSYLNSSGNPNTPFSSATWAGQGAQGTCAPYFFDTANNGASGVYTFCNPNSFQIISAGLDGNYGAGNCSFPSGGTANGPAGVNAYGQFDLDNLTNFSSKNLGDSVSQ